MIILSLITLIAIIQAYRSYPTITYTHTVHGLGFFISDEAMEDAMINLENDLYIFGDQSIESHGSPFERA